MSNKMEILQKVRFIASDYEFFNRLKKSDLGQRKELLEGLRRVVKEARELGIAPETIARHIKLGKRIPDVTGG